MVSRVSASIFTTDREMMFRLCIRLLEILSHVVLVSGVNVYDALQCSASFVLCGGFTVTHSFVIASELY